MNTILEPTANPYVGPRTFSEAQRHLFFGRDREGRDLLARVLSERLVLFYGQSGAGKSSLINTRLIPGLREVGYAVLPVGRVGGELPAGLEEADNVYLFNLMLSIAQAETNPGRFVGLTLSRFLAGLSTEDGQHYAYDGAAFPPPGAPGDGTAPVQPYVLIIDQFEELITGHPGRWTERAEFFRQLNRAMLDDPNLWAVLALREDYVAPIEPHAPLLADRMRARFYMERMGVDAALDAIRRPAGLGGRPFATGAAEQLVEDLRQVRVPGQEATIPGQYVEPVQLQVVCYQLWERLKVEGDGLKVEGGEEGIGSALTFGTNFQPSNLQPSTRFITETDLREAGDVDRALTQFYEETLAVALADPAAARVSERQLRTWFDKELITEAGTRNLVRQDEDETGGLPNRVVRAFQQRFLVRAEARGGDTWIEVVHDRFVEPIRASNAAWFPQHLSALQRQAALWNEQGRLSGLLLRDAALTEAEAWAAGHPEELQPDEQEFLAACRQAQDAVERERRQSRRIRILGIVAGVVAILAIVASVLAWNSSQLAQTNAAEAVRQKKIADEKSALAQDQLDRQAGLALLQEAHALKEKGNALGAIEMFRAAKATQTDLGIDVEAEIQDVRRQVATRLVQEGEGLAKADDFPGAEARFKAALALDPPPDTPVYLYVPAGEFVMGAGAEDDRIASEVELDNAEEHPQHPVTLDGYWIQRTEVTNAQYGRCVEVGGCEPPDDGNIRYRNAQFAKQPLTGVTWSQAQAYAAWAGGRLPTEAEWEKACRGTDRRIYPWGNQKPTGDLLNFSETGLGTWSAVGSYPDGASPYGALDMAGNVWEWTADWYDDKYYSDSPKENPTGPASGNERVLRGGSFDYFAVLVRCAVRGSSNPDFGLDVVGFRVVVSPGF